MGGRTVCNNWEIGRSVTCIYPVFWPHKFPLMQIIDLKTSGSWGGGGGGDLLGGKKNNSPQGNYVNIVLKPILVHRKGNLEIDLRSPKSKELILLSLATL